jgi:tetrapyrrole methylase family protein/MazG family protein
VNPEFALKGSIEKFINRFYHIEEEIQRRGKRIGAVSMKEMDEIWDAKKKLKN